MTERPKYLVAQVYSDSETHKDIPVSYGALEPGLRAAIDLLEREAKNETSAGEIADAREDGAEALKHAHNARAYALAQLLLCEQMVRLSQGVRQSWPGHPGEAG